MTTNDWLTIIAIIVAPIVALQIQKFLNDRKEKNARKMQIFQTLMGTRARPLSLWHVDALNMIDIEFYDNQKITEAWKMLLDNFCHYPQDINALDYQVKMQSCSDKSSELRAVLLCEMAKSLGYNFDTVHLKRGAYSPVGHANIESEQDFIRMSLVQVLDGRASIPIRIIGVEDGTKPAKDMTEKNNDEK